MPMDAKPEIIIHIEWTGPIPLAEVKSLNNEDKDFGIYQIYGGHPIYGASTLLYIGLAAEQTFGRRISQEEQWLYNRDAGRAEVYIGRLSDSRTPDAMEWDRQIRMAERLLIYAHMPPMNTQKNLATLEEDLKSVHVLNWANYRDLLPEVSGKRWTSRLHEIPGYHAYSMKEIKK